VLTLSHNNVSGKNNFARRVHTVNPSIALNATRQELSDTESN
jgi:predicted kinase